MKENLYEIIEFSNVLPSIISIDRTTVESLRISCVDIFVFV